ncbi:MAG: primosomal protein N' (replication factor Y) [Saprospiraceae bacterium]|jgi:primosomal protein N' (replication factor Y)
MLFVDVIVPLSVPNLFTYEVPKELDGQVGVGKRVVVQFGKSRFYTAIIRVIHEIEPQNYKAKPVQTVLDDVPVVYENQLKLWEWIASYYHCHIGDVMNSALPSAYKLVSETKILLTDKEVDFKILNDNEYLIVEALQLQNLLSLAEMSSILGVKSVHGFIKSLLDKDLIQLEEEMKGKYKPLIKTYLKLADQYNSEVKLLDLFQSLKSVAKQEDFLMLFTSQKGFNFKDFKCERANFLKKSGASRSSLNSLVTKGIISIENQEVNRLANYDGKVLDLPVLNAEQGQAKLVIDKGFLQDKVVLLNGVTGSGKTEVYFSLIQEQLDAGKQILYLLPEIALTTQLIERLKLVFGDKVGVYHSRYNINERVEVWTDLLKEEPKYKIIIGARSSLFLPYKNLGLIVVDEEHESSYKQFDPAPRYFARDVAIFMAKSYNAHCLLGTATPSVESFYNVQNGKYAYAELKTRHSGTLLPEIFCADLQNDKKKKKMTGLFSPLLKKEMEEALENNEQIILFQNRRGYAPYLECDACGHSETCNRCDVSLTFHKGVNQLRCHYCGYTQKIELACSACGSVETGLKGFGTEMIQEEVNKYFPSAKVARMDLDTTRGKNAYLDLITKFADKEIDVLVGTQMLTKGLDFGNVSLVGVLNADQMLNYPDFRAHERAYQLLTQVSGRSGRRKKRGKVVFQTYSPYHTIIRNVIENDFQGMYENEILNRKNFDYPPFYRLINITMKHRDKSLLDACAEGFGIALKGELTEKRVLGPEYPSISRINNLYQKTILVKFEKSVAPKAVKDIIQKWINIYKKESAFQRVRFNVNVDPQ